LKTDIVILSTEGDIDAISTSIDSVKKSTFKQLSVSIAIGTNANGATLYIDLKEKYPELNIRVNFNINNCISGTTDKNKGSYSTIIRAGSILPPTYLDKLNFRINSLMEKVLYVKPTDNVDVVTASNLLLGFLTITDYETLQKNVEQCIKDYSHKSDKNEFQITGDELCNPE